MTRDADPEVDLDLLLEHRSFVRGLARSLVRDEARAEDVEQETWLAALRRPPHHAGALRAWLASVVKKLAWTANRGETRRARRERTHDSRRLPVPTPPEVLERAVWSQRIVSAVMDLDEPYRSTVLLRYFEGLKSSEIAQLHGVPAATVRTRLRRALAQLRDRLDAEVEGGRGAWVMALAPLAFPPVPLPAGADTPPAEPSRVPWKAVAAGVVVSVVALVVLFRSALVGPDQHPRSAGANRAGVESESKEVAPAPTATRGEQALEVVVHAGGRPAAGARIALALREPHAWRYTPFDRWNGFAEALADKDGVARFEGLAAGDLRVFATLRGFARGSAVTHLPSAFDEPVVIELRPEDPWEVQVTELGTGGPVEGASIQLRETPDGPYLPDPAPLLTARDGSATVTGLRVGQPARVRIEAKGYLPRGPVPVDNSEPWVAELERSDREVRWPVRASALTPADGASLRLRRVNQPVEMDRATYLAGEIVGQSLPRGEIPEMLAIAPDGVFARLFADAQVERGKPVAFERPPRLEVVLRDSRGAPIEGAELRLHARVSGTRIHPGGLTDEQGYADLPVYASDPVEVRVRKSAAQRFRTLGLYDPGAGDGRFRYVVPAARSVRLRVEPGLPGLFELYAGRERLRAEALTIDSDRKALSFLVRPAADGDPVQLHLLARGFVAAAMDLDLTSTEPLLADLRLERAGTLVLPVLLREENQPFRLELVSAGDEQRELWRGPWRFRLYPGPDRVVREAMIPAGTYRVRDGISGSATPAFRVAAGETVENLFLDLSRPRESEVEMVRGWVEAYPDLDLSLSTVEVTEPERGRVSVAEVARDGSFAFAWRSHCHLRARHPAVDPVRAVEIELAEPREDVLLKLTPWNRAFVRLDPLPGAALEGGTSPRILLVDGERRVTLGAVVEGAELRFAGHRAGRCDLWIDLSGFAPRLVPEVELREGTTDLGTISLTRGTRLEFTVRQPEEVLTPDLLITAQALDEPRYQRSVRSGGATRARLDGLGSGEFLVCAWERDTRRRVWSRRLTANGRDDQTLEIDLR